MGGTSKGATIPVTETFCLFLNATPSNDARIAFDDDHPAHITTMLPVGHMAWVSESYGFEFSGHLNNGILNVSSW
jgi:hypothetical protein